MASISQGNSSNESRNQLDAGVLYKSETLFHRASLSPSVSSASSSASSSSLSPLTPRHSPHHSPSPRFSFTSTSVSASSYFPAPPLPHTPHLRPAPSPRSIVTSLPLHFSSPSTALFQFPFFPSPFFPICLFFSYCLY